VSADQNKWVSIGSGELRAEINPLGAQLFTLKDHSGSDLLWGGDPSVWSGRAPILFPIVGALEGGSYRLGSSTYQLPRHGFARGRMFATVDSDAGMAHFRLKADESSMRVYPFRFELEIRFSLQGATLSVTTVVRNQGESIMPASFGYHPAFRWPLPYGQDRSAHFIDFAEDELAPVRRLNAAGLLMPQRYPTPINFRRLTLIDSLFENDAIIFDQIQSRCVTYRAAQGPQIQISFPDAAFLGIWSKPQANFVCIEPWHGIADPDGFCGDFRVKPGVFMVEPGAAAQIKMSITLLGI
jgi:galactose mutarotase-like enzyme